MATKQQKKQKNETALQSVKERDRQKAAQNTQGQKTKQKEVKKTETATHGGSGGNPAPGV